MIGYIFILQIIIMQHKQGHLAGSPKNVIVNVLNANNFFTLDYEVTQPTFEMRQTIHNFYGNQTKLNENRAYFKINNIKSAQYSRKLLNTSLINRMSFNPHSYIKKAEENSSQKKQRQTSLENRRDLRLIQISKYLPNVTECRTERINRDQQKGGLLKSFTIDPEVVHDQSKSSKHWKKNEKNINSFSENYKNRKKLLDKLTHKKVSQGGSPLRWGTKPEDLIKDQLKSKHWSPYTGRLNRGNDPLLSSIEGNKIKYTHHEPKYYKGKHEQIHKI